MWKVNSDGISITDPSGKIYQAGDTITFPDGTIIMVKSDFKGITDEDLRKYVPDARSWNGMIVFILNNQPEKYVDPNWNSTGHAERNLQTDYKITSRLPLNEYAATDLISKNYVDLETDKKIDKKSLATINGQNIENGGNITIATDGELAFIRDNNQQFKYNDIKPLHMNNQQIGDVADPTNQHDVVTLQYFNQNRSADPVWLPNGHALKDVSMFNYTIDSNRTSFKETDLVTKRYVDTAIENGGGEGRIPIWEEVLGQARLIHAAPIDAQNQLISKVAAPVADSDVATKGYVDAHSGGGSGDSLWELSGGILRPISANPLSVRSRVISDVLDPVADTDAANKKYVDSRVPDMESRLRNIENSIYQIYQIYNVPGSGASWEFEDYDPAYWHHFYVTISRNNQVITGWLEVAADLDLNGSVSAVISDTVNESSNNLIFNLDTHQLTCRNWTGATVQMIRVAVYRKLAFVAPPRTENLK